MLAAIICFTPVVINGMFPGSTPRLDVAIGAGIITIFILTIVRAGLLSAVAALFTHFVAAARADHDGFLELARHHRPVACRHRAGLGPWRLLLRAQRRRRTRHDFLTWTRIGVPISPNDSRNWFARNRTYEK